MQCYQTLAATLLIAKYLETHGGTGHALPHAVIADWMDQQGIAAEEILFARHDSVQALLGDLLGHSQPGIAQSSRAVGASGYRCQVTCAA